MDDRQNENSGEKAENEASRPPIDKSEAAGGSASEPAVEGRAAAADSAKRAALRNLPMVLAPKLAGGDIDESPHDDFWEDIPRSDAAAASDGAYDGPEDMMAGEPAGGAGTPAAKQRSFRFAVLAASIALAAGIGSYLGSLTASGVINRSSGDGALPRSADARDVLQALRAEVAELSAMKTSLAGATRNANTQFAKITDRLDSLEHAQVDPAAKIAHIADTLDKLDKRPAAASEITGSIASPASAPAPAAAATPAAPPPVLNDWIVQDVRNGRAMVENRFGGLFMVGAGSMLPGLGRVEAVKRQNGEWVVVTAKGIIPSAQ